MELGVIYFGTFYLFFCHNWQLDFCFLFLHFYSEAPNELIYTSLILTSCGSNSSCLMGIQLLLAKVCSVELLKISPVFLAGIAMICTSIKWSPPLLEMAWLCLVIFFGPVYYVFHGEKIQNVTLAGLLKSRLVPKNHKKLNKKCGKIFRLSKVARAEIQAF